MVNQYNFKLHDTTADLCQNEAIMPRLLLVENDLGLCRILCDGLTNQYFRVDMIHDGEGALKRLKTHEYDLILLDSGLPDFTGIEITKHIRANGGRIPIIMLTANQGIDYRKMDLQAGVDYLTKPFEMKELLKRIRVMLRY